MLKFAAELEEAESAANAAEPVEKEQAKPATVLAEKSLEEQYADTEKELAAAEKVQKDTKAKDTDSKKKTTMKKETAKEEAKAEKKADTATAGKEVEGKLDWDAVAEKARQMQEKYASAEEIPDTELPEQFDWRNYHGFDFTGEVRD